MAQEHKYTSDTDRCICGGVVVFFEGEKEGDAYGEGCEVNGAAWDGKIIIEVFKVPGENRYETYIGKPGEAL